MKPCNNCQQSGWADKVQRSPLGPFPWPKCGYCKSCNGRGWVSDEITSKETDNEN